jgi:hypothetical protein
MAHHRLAQILAVIVAVCLITLPSVAQKKPAPPNKRKDNNYLREQQKNLEQIFLHQTVMAKMTMPMTTFGVDVTWDKKKSEWVVNANQRDLQKYGVGVKAGERYGITNVDVKPGAITFWLNDGGAIDTGTRIADGFAGFGSTLDQMKHNQEMQRKQASANGSRVHVYIYELTETEGEDLVTIAREQSARFFLLCDAASADPRGANGTILLSTDPQGADIWVDESFMGQTPARVTVPPGKRKIRLSLQGYETWNREMDVGSGAETTLSIPLKKMSP